MILRALYGIFARLPNVLIVTITMQLIAIMKSFKNGRYTPLHLLGTGTYGQVICCRDEKTGQNVAVKVAQEKPAYRSAALSESHVLNLLLDCNEVVNIIDTFEQDGRICIVSELLAANLYEVMRKRQFSPLSIADIARIAKRVITALSNLHRLGYMHCDVKPENIMVGSLVTPKDETNMSTSLGQYASYAHFQGHTMNGDLSSISKGISSESSYKSHLKERHNPFSSPCKSDSTTCDQRCNKSEDVQSWSLPMHSEHQVVDNNPSVANSKRVLYKDCGATDFGHTYLIDFGAVREFRKNMYYDIQSLWYRAPEVLCELPYSVSIDSWSVGCVLFELYSGRPLFQGRDPQDQLNRIVEHVGFPSVRALTACRARQSQMTFPAVYGTYETMKMRLRDILRSSRSQATHLQTLGNNNKNNINKLGNNSQYDDCPTQSGASKNVIYHNEDGVCLMKDVNVGCQGGEHVGRDLRTDFTSIPSPNEGAVFSASFYQNIEECLIDLILALLHPDEELRLKCTDALHHPLFDITENMSVCSTTAMGPTSSRWTEPGQSCFIATSNHTSAAETAIHHALQPPVPATFSQQPAKHLSYCPQYSVGQPMRNLYSVQKVSHNCGSGMFDMGANLGRRGYTRQNSVSQCTNFNQPTKQADAAVPSMFNAWTRRSQSQHLQACNSRLVTSSQVLESSLIEQRPPPSCMNGHSSQQLGIDMTENDYTDHTTKTTKKSAPHSATAQNLFYDRTTRSKTSTSNDTFASRQQLTSNARMSKSCATFASVAPETTNIALKSRALAKQASVTACNSAQTPVTYFERSNSAYTHNDARVPVNIASPVYVHVQTVMRINPFTQDAGVLLVPSVENAASDNTYYLQFQQKQMCMTAYPKQNIAGVGRGTKDHQSLTSIGAVHCPVNNTTNMSRHFSHGHEGHDCAMHTCYSDLSSISIPGYPYTKSKDMCNAYLPSVELSSSLNGNINHGLTHSWSVSNAGMC